MSASTDPPVSLRPGDPFNPYKRFHGIFVPEQIHRSSLSLGAKLTYGRLCRYAGQDGNAYPSVATLGQELGVCTRQARRYIHELEKERFIRIEEMSGQTNRYIFLWHRLLDPGSTPFTPDKSGTPGGKSDTPDKSVRGTPDKSVRPTPDIYVRLRESVVRESGKENRDFDCASRKNSGPHECKYPKLREALTYYMRTEPTERQVLNVMEAVSETEAEVVRCLVFLYNERELIPGTENGPRSFAWFPTVVQDFFHKRAMLPEAARPSSYDEWEFRNEKREANRH